MSFTIVLSALPSRAGFAVAVAVTGVGAGGNGGDVIQEFAFHGALSEISFIMATITLARADVEKNWGGPVCSFCFCQHSLGPTTTVRSECAKLVALTIFEQGRV